MKNFLQIKKRKIIILLILFFNQFSFYGYALNNKKSDLDRSEINNLQSKFYITFDKLLARENNNQINSIKKEEQEIEDFANEIEDFLEETFPLNNSENLNNQKTKSPFKNKRFRELEQKSTNKLDEKNKLPLKKDGVNEQEQENKNKVNKKTKSHLKSNNNEVDKGSKSKDKTENNHIKEQKKFIIKVQDKEVINRENRNSSKKAINKLPLPSRSTISTSEFKVPPRGYVNLKGPKITLNLQNTDSKETLKLIAKLGEYGIVIVDDKNLKGGKKLNQPKISANFKNANISDVFNSILLSSNLQAVVENNIIFVGENILNKSLKPKVSKTYRLNQVNAASVADYLSTLGAQISKVSVLSGSSGGSEVGDSFLNKKEFKDKPINSYGIDGGPLLGLVGTADLRLQTITLIGRKDLMKTAEKYIKNLDVRHRQVALTIKIIDVSLTKSDIKNNVFELRNGNTRIINNSGFGLRTGNFDSGNPPSSANVPNVISGGVAQNKFVNWLESKITNENAKILASPTLILGENSSSLSSGAALIDDSLSSATIGRPFKNEGFIKVGETVITGFQQTNNEGVVTCTATEGTAGITFGAKVDKIDDNGYVTFALSPAISSVTKSVEIAGCGIQNTLSVRKLDTGSIRVKNNDTLILTGVLQDSDNVTTSKVPIIGDIPILGSLFRSNSTQKRKSELIILVTPKILKDK
jgi:type IV pilus assembly protein PilQ